MAVASEKIVEVKDSFGSHWTDYLLWGLGSFVTWIVATLILSVFLDGGVALFIGTIIAIVVPRGYFAVICRDAK